MFLLPHGNDFQQVSLEQIHLGQAARNIEPVQLLVVELEPAPQVLETRQRVVTERVRSGLIGAGAAERCAEGVDVGSLWNRSAIAKEWVLRVDRRLGGRLLRRGSRLRKSGGSCLPVALLRVGVRDVEEYALKRVNCRDCWFLT
jgi:hypothetical protein